MARFFAIATIMEMRIIVKILRDEKQSLILDRNNSFYVVPRMVIFQLEILILKIKDILNVRIYHHTWKFSWFTCELQFHLLNMIKIYVRISCGIDKIPWLKTTYLSDPLTYVTYETT